MLVFGSVIVFFCDLGPGFFWDSFFQVALKYLHAKHQPLLVTSGHSRGVLPSTLAPKDVGWLLNGAGSCMSFDKGGVFRCESLGFTICKVRGCGYTPVFFLNVFPKLGWLGMDFWHTSSLSKTLWLASHVVHLELNPRNHGSCPNFLDSFWISFVSRMVSQRLSHILNHAAFHHSLFCVWYSHFFLPCLSCPGVSPAMGHKTRQQNPPKIQRWSRPWRKKHLRKIQTFVPGPGTIFQSFRLWCGLLLGWYQ